MHVHLAKAIIDHEELQVAKVVTCVWRYLTL